MDSFSNWFKEVIFVTIPGFIYLLSVFLLLPLDISNYILGGIIYLKDYFLYIFILLIISSYTIGVVIHMALQRIIWWICPKFKKEFDKAVDSKVDKKKLTIIREAQVMIRHLVISVSLLGLGFLIYFIRIGFDNIAYCLLILCLIFDLILFLAYHFQRSVLTMHKNKL